MRYNNVCKRIYIAIAALWLCGATAKAQYDATFSHYFDMETSFNVAAVGKQPKLNITGAYAMNFAGFKHNPRTMYLSADMPFLLFNNYHGAGVQFMNDQLGLFTHQRISIQYAYRHRLFGGMLSAGIQVGMLSEKFDGSRADLGEANDPAFSTAKEDGNGIDLGAGLYYIHDAGWYAGASVSHLNAPRIELGERNELNISPTYYLTGGYNIQLRNPFVTIKPSVLLRTDGIAYRADITTRVVYTNEKRELYAGLGYSPTNSVTAFIGGSVKGIILGYSYELYTSAISPGNGSHELFIGYQTDINLTKKGRNRHQSVRTL